MNTPRITAIKTEANTWELDGENIAADVDLTLTPASSGTGYICKKCGDPSPMGVGYATSTPHRAIAAVSRRITQCACGWSQLAPELHQVAITNTWID